MKPAHDTYAPVSTDAELNAVFEAIHQWGKAKALNANDAVVERRHAVMRRLVIALKYPDGPDDKDAA